MLNKVSFWSVSMFLISISRVSAGGDLSSTDYLYDSDCELHTDCGEDIKVMWSCHSEDGACAEASASCVCVCHLWSNRCEDGEQTNICFVSIYTPPCSLRALSCHAGELRRSVA